MAWNEEGLYFAVEVRKRKPVRSHFGRHWTGDSFQIWLDTRDVKSARRAGRYCHQFNCLPTGGGDDGNQPVVKPTQVDRARERWNMPEQEALPIASLISDRGYTPGSMPADGSAQRLRPRGIPPAGIHLLSQQFGMARPMVERRARTPRPRRSQHLGNGGV